VTPEQLRVRGLMSLLFHGEKAIDVVEAALSMGLLAELDAGPVTLGELVERLGMRAERLDKLLDCLDSLSLIAREPRAGPVDVAYRSVVPLVEPAMATVGPESIERDRNRHAWAKLRGRLPEVLRGAPGIPSEDFAWPPRTPEQVASFERSLSLGLAPAIAVFRACLPELVSPHETAVVRWLDVGGGDGALGAALVGMDGRLQVDVFNLPSVRAVFEERRARDANGKRLRFVPGDFLAEPLPPGYDIVSFVRVLHDWPLDVARDLIQKAKNVLPRGGRLLISEELRTPERLAVQFFWSYFLIGVDGCASRLRSLEDYRKVLNEEGFSDVHVVDGAFDLIVATR